MTKQSSLDTWPIDNPLTAARRSTNLGSAMRYWWVNHKQTFRHEFEGRYIWSPKRKRDGSRNRFYDFLREVTPGLRLFRSWSASIAAWEFIRNFSRRLASVVPFLKHQEENAARVVFGIELSVDSVARTDRLSSISILGKHSVFVLSAGLAQGLGKPSAVFSGGRLWPLDLEGPSMPDFSTKAARWR